MSKYEQYEHHGCEVWVEKKLKGKHRDHCLCWNCQSFKPDTVDNCKIAASLFKICQEHNLVTPVYECQIFKAKDDTK